MRTLSVASATTVVVVLLIVPSVASALPAKRHKPHAAAAAAPSRAPTRPDDSDADPTAKPVAEAEPQAQPQLPDPAPPTPPEPALTTPLADIKPPPEPHREALGARDDEALGRREAARLAAGRNEVGVSVSVDMGNRRFSYSDPVGEARLRPYTLTAAPMASFGLEAYPLATSSVPVLRDLGFRGHFSRAFAVNSNTPEGDTIDTSWTRFGGEIRERVLVPGKHRFELGIDAGGDASYFVMSTKAKVAALLPSARSVSLRLGLDARLLLAGRLSLLIGGAYLVSTSAGEIYDRFRDPHVAGIDGDFGAALSLAPGLEARLTGRYTRYFASFKPVIGDANVAGGALDQQLQFGLGARYAH